MAAAHSASARARLLTGDMAGHLGTIAEEQHPGGTRSIHPAGNGGSTVWVRFDGAPHALPVPFEKLKKVRDYTNGPN